jgi:hypothetical protein
MPTQDDNRPLTKVINVATGEETFEPMSDADYEAWLAQCEINNAE